GGFDRLEHFLMFHASLTVYDQRGQLVPRLAEKLPSTTDGDWNVLPDGRMEVTWRLKPNLAWHDGTPLTADDFVFGAQVVKDPQIPATKPPWVALVADVQAPDSRTVVARWKETSFLAGGTGATDLPALPRHILDQLYEAPNKNAF